MQLIAQLSPLRLKRTHGFLTCTNHHTISINQL
ncbi:Uncharacterised protein [Vibrio cholerae]|nr:Uncharacterised protein [Vibrio cholerae]